MKVGLATSTALHAALLTFGLLTLSAPPAHEVLDVESLPVDIVPIEEITNVQAGDKKAPLQETPAPVPTARPDIVENAVEVGDNAVDTKAPPVPESRPREVQTAALPPPAPTPVERPVTEPKAEPKPPEPVPATEVAPQPAPRREVTPEPKQEAAPAEIPVPDKAPVPQPAPKPEPVRAAEPAPKVEPKPEPVKQPEPAPQPKPEPVKQAEPAPKPEPKPAEIAEQKPAETPDPVAEAIAAEKAEPKPAPVAETKPAPKPEQTASAAPAQPEQASPDAVQLPSAAPRPEARPRPAPAPAATAQASTTQTAQAQTAQAQTAKTPERKSTEKPAEQAGSRAASSEKEFNANEIAALLNKDKPAGGGAKRSTQQAALGGERTNSAGKLSQNEMDALRQRLGGCWSVPAGVDDTDALKVSVRFKLDRSGNLDGRPEVIRGGASSGPGRIAAESAVRAVQKCEPFNLPADKYETWAEVVVNFDPTDMF